MGKRITIKDIAQKSGVSTGTVDRVIHNRGNVAPEVTAIVLQVMEDLGFERNLMASTLAYNRVFRIVALIPDPAIDAYWEQPFVGIQHASKAIQHYGIEVEFKFFDLFSPADFKVKSAEVLETAPQGILFPPIFESVGIELLEGAQERNIPCVLINTFLEHKDALSYIGQNSFQSGVLAGRLLDFSIKDGEAVFILNLDKETQNARHLQDKQQGFMHYFEQKSSKNITVRNFDFEAFEDEVALQQFINTQLESHPNVAGLFVTNSRAYKLVQCLTDQQLHKLSIVGFDLIPQNIQLLNEEKINFLINQNSVEQGLLGIYYLFRILFKKEKTEQFCYLPLDIVVPENLEYYLNKQANLTILG